MTRGQAKWKRARILIIEDDPGDQEIIRRALGSGGFCADIDVIDNGTEAIDFLQDEEVWADPSRSRRPDLILLDLNLPGCSGKRVLEMAKQREGVRRTPIVVVSTSARDSEIRDSYELGCNSYLIKPLEAHRFIAALRDIYEYWFGVVSLPSA